ncbi:tetratricopeptide repeat protein [Balneolaceae bacterium ANBcel3]|nr:tetratricopeptide repeat protein [Balneolaceae bacterium ANBcel3]
MKKSILFLFFCLFPLAAFSIQPPSEESLLLQPDFQEDARHAIQLLYNRDTEGSLRHLESWTSTHPDHPAWVLWPSMDAWWPIMNDLEYTGYDDFFIRQSENVIDYCTGLINEGRYELDARVVRAIAQAQLARYYSNRQRWYRSFRNARRALNDLFDLEETHPEIPDLQFGVGMYRYFAAHLLEAYPLARPVGWMLPRGDKEEGLERLTTASSNAIFLEPEAIYFLGHIYLHFENRPNKALSYLKELYSRYPDNPFYHRLYIRALYRLNQTQQARTVIEESLSYFENNESHEVRALREDLLSILGIIHYHLRRYHLAEQAFTKAIETGSSMYPERERSNVILSWYYLGQTHMRYGSRTQAKRYFEKAAQARTDHPNRQTARKALEDYSLK